MSESFELVWKDFEIDKLIHPYHFTVRTHIITFSNATDDRNIILAAGNCEVPANWNLYNGKVMVRTLTMEEFSRQNTLNI